MDAEDQAKIEAVEAAYAALTGGGEFFGAQTEPEVLHTYEMFALEQWAFAVDFLRAFPDDQPAAILDEDREAARRVAASLLTLYRGAAGHPGLEPKADTGAGSPSTGASTSGGASAAELGGGVRVELVIFDPADEDTYPSVCGDQDEVLARFGFEGGEVLAFDLAGSFIGQVDVIKLVAEETLAEALARAARAVPPQAQATADHGLEPVIVITRHPDFEDDINLHGVEAEVIYIDLGSQFDSTPDSAEQARDWAKNIWAEVSDLPAGHPARAEVREVIATTCERRLSEIEIDRLTGGKAPARA